MIRNLSVAVPRALIAAGLAVTMATVAEAQITVDAITAQWSNAVGGQNVAINNAATPIDIRWGVTPPGGLRSGYDFTPTAPPSFGVVVPMDGFALFNLGTFNHRNFPIFRNTNINSVDLGVTLDIDGAVPNNFSQTFTIFHEETPNDEVPCAYGGANFQGVNINGCADRVTFGIAGSQNSFTVNGINYGLTLEGFSSDPLNYVGTSDFLTIENQENEAYLFARIFTVEVPEPSSVALLLVGLGAFGAAARRRRTV